MRNNRLFKKNLTQSKGNRMTKLGRFFFGLRLISKYILANILNNIKNYLTISKNSLNIIAVAPQTVLPLTSK